MFKALCIATIPIMLGAVVAGKGQHHHQLGAKKGRRPVTTSPVGSETAVAIKQAITERQMIEAERRRRARKQRDEKHKHRRDQKSSASESSESKSKSSHRRHRRKHQEKKHHKSVSSSSSGSSSSEHQKHRHHRQKMAKKPQGAGSKKKVSFKKPKRHAAEKKLPIKPKAITKAADRLLDHINHNISASYESSESSKSSSCEKIAVPRIKKPKQPCMKKPHPHRPRTLHGKKPDPVIRRPKEPKRPCAKYIRKDIHMSSDSSKSSSSASTVAKKKKSPAEAEDHKWNKVAETKRHHRRGFSLSESFSRSRHRDRKNRRFKKEEKNRARKFIKVRPHKHRHHVRHITVNDCTESSTIAFDVKRMIEKRKKRSMSGSQSFSRSRSSSSANRRIRRKRRCHKRSCRGCRRC